MTATPTPTPASRPAPTPAASIVRTRGLTKLFGSHMAVDGLDLSVERGSVYGLLGPNGAGKTTALKLLLGLLHPTRGQVSLFGQPWRRASLARVGALIEQPAVYPHLSGHENLAVHAALLGLPKSRVREALRRVDLDGAGDRRAGQYSLGMKQRLGLAIALLNDPELLILDEPTNGLDPAGIREVRDMVKAFPAHGTTVIVSSHLLAEVSHVASHVGVIAQGQARYQGRLEDLLSQGRGGLAVETPQPERARAVLAPRFPGLQLTGNELVVPVAEDKAAGVVSELAQNGVAVTRMNYRHDDLEALFLRLVGETEAKA